MTDEQIKHMADRFLGWPLPTDFRPDGGVSFSPIINQSTGRPYEGMPTGTNVFNADQAIAMVRYMIEGLPSSPGAP
jgi:hypothetical protein